ncbi:MAG: CmpA/NrtA family ABC transporter substrate-binding protein [Pseudanabaenaceae cyanobacterium SKYGB_i_bin29]|nr:ABC transporter substrate-binding protein [Pseudanabaenaceae cyanobacterium SKYG29]MDW8422012.1 CmpA/NrtA family ABC transporter substrate-binding protein [Pseudanabaenaceae cyanobacterium SKYGB_i_bin29]
MKNTTRRQFILGASSTAVTVLAGKGGEALSQSSLFVASADTPEVTKAKLGFIALTDAAPLIIAKAKGYFAKYGMPDVEVVKQASWGVTRDNLVLGSEGGGIDGAHILTPMPYLISAGIVTGGKKVPLYILARLNLNGQGISLSNEYKGLKVGLNARPLKEVFAKKRAQGKEVKVAMTFPGGTHDMWVRYWLAAADIDPTKEVSTIVVPPPQMVANVKTGTMDAFCVGEPWPLQTVNQKVGFNVATTGEIWKDHPEKSFTMRADWVDKYPKATKAILMAILDAQRWCDKDENKPEMCRILSDRNWLKAPYEDIIDRSLGKFDFGNGRVFEDKNLMQKYWRDFASYPFPTHELWFLTENIRWGYFKADTDTKALIKAVNREDLWREAAKALNIPKGQIPASTSRGKERFFDGVVFDPEKPEEYLAKLKIKQLKA